jgi:hypothetical protein
MNEDGETYVSNGLPVVQVTGGYGQKLLRQTFCDMLISGAPGQLLFDKYWFYMADTNNGDRARATRDEQLAKEAVLAQLQDRLRLERYSLEDFNMVPPNSASLRQDQVLAEVRRSLQKPKTSEEAHNELHSIIAAAQQ